MHSVRLAVYFLLTHFTLSLRLTILAWPGAVETHPRVSAGSMGLESSPVLVQGQTLTVQTKRGLKHSPTPISLKSVAPRSLTFSPATAHAAAKLSPIKQRHVWRLQHFSSMLVNVLGFTGRAWTGLELANRRKPPWVHAVAQGGIFLLPINTVNFNSSGGKKLRYK